MSEQQLSFDDYVRPAGELETRKAALLNRLRGHGWVTSRQLKEEGFSDRDLREIVENDFDFDIFSHPGSPGYKYFGEVTLEEFNKCHSLKSQADKMTHRYTGYYCRFHRGRVS
ncbi:MAG: hypothetical protein ABIT76_08845 [Chthoniobacterales bacterium]